MRYAALLLIAFALVRIGLVYGANFARFRGEQPAAMPAAPAQSEVHHLKGIDSYAKVDPFVRRFDVLKSSLPVGGTVGFISDLPLDDPLRGEILILVRYALVPVKVEDDASLPWVVGAFDAPADAARAIPAGLERVATYAQGVALFRRRND
ncbi:hypothetical protein D3C86_1410100 [compost metagenome]